MSKTALLVIDAQESFRHRPYWTDSHFPEFVHSMQILLDGARTRRVPVLRVFHADPDGPFSLASGYVDTLAELSFAPEQTFHKSSHSALVGSGLDVWLIRHGIERVIVSGIRSEQCCETTTRHASDMGYDVDYVTEATLTFPMRDRSGRIWTVEEIKQRTELVLEDRFASIVTVKQALEKCE